MTINDESLTCRLYTFTRKGLAISSALSMPPLSYLKKEDIEFVSRCCRYKKLLVKYSLVCRTFTEVDTQTPLESMLRYGYRLDDDIAITYDRTHNSVKFYDVRTKELIMEEYL